MIFPKINFENGSRDMITSFGGYRHSDKTASNEFFDMTNMTSDRYPLLSPRPKRVAASTVSLGTITAITAKNGALWYVENGVLIESRDDHNDPTSHDIGLSNDGNTKQLVAMGAYLIIYPDKIYINTTDTTDFGSIEAVYSIDGTATVEICNQRGETYAEVMVGNGDATGEVTEDDSLNLDSLVALNIAKHPHTLQRYDPLAKGWYFTDGYIKIASEGIGASLSVGDSVFLTNAAPTLDETAIPDTYGIEGLWLVSAKGNDYIVIKTLSQEGSLRDLHLERSAPDLDFVIESNNRLWGCSSSYIDGKPVNEIYASKLGDFRNWHSFEGISTDSYAVSVGSDGSFTGAVTYNGYPTFFKADCIHKIYGTMPSNYQVQTHTCEGVQSGSHQSLAVVGGLLIYLSDNGIFAYDGSQPISISNGIFGEGGCFPYRNGIAGAVASKYYISMRDSNDTPHLFVYDTKNALWHKEDNADILGFATIREELYFILTDQDGTWLMGYNTNGESEGDVKWHVETGIIGTDSPYQKYISRVDVRMMLNVDSTVRFAVEYNSSGSWEIVCVMRGTTTQSFGVPIRLNRCDHFRLRMDGVGEAKIFSISKVTRQGSEINA